MVSTVECAYPMKVSASNVERWSYWSTGTKGMAICWSGPVTVCNGIGMGMYDMVVVSKCSMARGGVAVVGDGVAIDSAHTRGASGADPAMRGALARGGGAWNGGAATRAAEVVGGWWWWLGGRCVGGPWGWKRRGAGGQVAERRRWGMRGQQQRAEGEKCRGRVACTACAPARNTCSRLQRSRESWTSSATTRVHHTCGWPLSPASLLGARVWRRVWRPATRGYALPGSLHVLARSHRPLVSIYVHMSNASTTLTHTQVCLSCEPQLYAPLPSFIGRASLTDTPNGDQRAPLSILRTYGSQPRPNPTSSMRPPPHHLYTPPVALE